MTNRRIHRGVLAGLGLALAATMPMPSDAGEGQENLLRRHPLTTLDGESTTLGAWDGEVVVVNFWASWCKPCRKELPVMDNWNETWSERGGRVVAISVDHERNKAVRFVDKVGLRMPVVHDGPDGLAQALDIPSLPCTFLLDRDGRVVHEVRGGGDEDLAELHRRVESLLADAEVSR